jgi:hypothetical protein
MRANRDWATGRPQNYAKGWTRAQHPPRRRYNQGSTAWSVLTAPNLKRFSVSCCSHLCAVLGAHESIREVTPPHTHTHGKDLRPFVTKTLAEHFSSEKGRQMTVITYQTWAPCPQRYRVALEKKYISYEAFLPKSLSQAKSPTHTPTQTEFHRKTVIVVIIIIIIPKPQKVSLQLLPRGIRLEYIFYSISPISCPHV